MTASEPADRDIPQLAIALGAAGALEAIGGIILCAQLWPGEPESGYRWLFSAYVPALTWLVAGIVSGLLFFAAAAIITYLVHIRDISNEQLASSRRLEAMLSAGHEEPTPNTEDVQ